MRQASGCGLGSPAIGLPVFSAFAQTGADPIGEITAALRPQLLNGASVASARPPALSKQYAVIDAASASVSGKRAEQECLAAFRRALKISPDYVPALEGSAQLEYDAGNASSAHAGRMLAAQAPAAVALIASRNVRRSTPDGIFWSSHFEQSFTTKKG
jgi:hypothetical protein